MAFKTLEEYNVKKYENLFVLQNDGDSADVIFLYKDIKDVLVCDVHYVKSAEYSGYVQCVGRGCPACSKGIRTQTKLFIPLFNLTTNRVEFWDRSMMFEQVLKRSVFEGYPNPSEFVFKIVRHGVPRDVNTTYEITPIAKNSVYPYDKLLADNHISFPESYSVICKDLSAAELSLMLNSSGDNSIPVGDMPDYQVKPRAAVSNVPTSDTIAEPSYDDNEFADYVPPAEEPPDEISSTETANPVDF